MSNRVGNQTTPNAPPQHDLTCHSDDVELDGPADKGDGVSCRELRKQVHQANHTLAGRVAEGLEAGRGGVSLRRSGPPRPPDRKKTSRAALHATFEANCQRIVNSAGSSPAAWQALAADILADPRLDLGMLAVIDEAALKREVVMVLRPAGLEPAHIDSSAASLYKALAHAAGHQFFHGVQSNVRVTLEDVCGRLEHATGDDLGLALLDGLQIVGPETANDLRQQLLRAPPTAEQQRALSDQLRSALERRIEKLTRTPDPTALLTDYPGVVAAHAAARGVGVSLRQTSLPERARDRLAALFAPFLPAVQIKRVVDTWNGDVRVRGDSILAEGLRMRCDFDRMLDLSYRLVSEAATGSLTTTPNWQNQVLRDLLLDELKTRSLHGAAELLGWTAEAAGN